MAGLCDPWVYLKVLLGLSPSEAAHPFLILPGLGPDFTQPSPQIAHLI